MSNPLLPSQTHTHETDQIPDFDTAVTNQSNVALSTAHRLDINANPHDVTTLDVNLNNVPNVKQNLTAVVAPLPGDDNLDGYAVGSRWINTATNIEYVCTNASMGAAIWVALPGTTTTLAVAGNAFESIGYDGAALDNNTAGFIAASPGYSITGSTGVVIASGGTWAATASQQNMAVATNGTLSGAVSVIACNVGTAGTFTDSSAIAATGAHSGQGTVGFSRSDDVAGHSLVQYDAAFCVTGDRIVSTCPGSFYCGVAGTHQNPSSGNANTSGFDVMASNCNTTFTAGVAGDTHNNIGLMAINGGTITATANSSIIFQAASSGNVDYNKPATGAAGFGSGVLYTSGNHTMNMGRSAVMCTANNRTPIVNTSLIVGNLECQTYTVICDSGAKKDLRNVDELLAVDNNAWMDALDTVKPKQFQYTYDDDAEPPRLGFSTEELDATDIFSFCVAKEHMTTRDCTYDAEADVWRDDENPATIVAVELILPYANEVGAPRAMYPVRTPTQFNRVDYMSLLQVLHVTLQKQYALITQLETDINAFLNV